MFKNMKIGLRLGTGFGVIIVLIMVMALYSLVQVSKISSDMDQVVNDYLPKSEKANEVLDLINQVARALRNMALLKDPVEIQKEGDRVEDCRSKATAIFKELEAKVNTEEGKRLLNDILTARTEYAPHQQKAIKLTTEGKRDEATALMMGDMRITQNKYMEALAELNAYLAKVMDTKGEESTKLAASVKTTLIAISLIILLLGIFAAIIITRSITSPLTKCIEVAENVSQGKTDIDIKVDSKDETGMLLSAMEKMIKSIRSLIEDTGSLSKAAVDGSLSVRADLSKHSGDYRKVIEGVNKTLDAIVDPLKESITVLEKVADRDLRARVNGDYKGDLAKIKNALNSAADNLDKALQQVSEATEQVSSASQQISAGSQSLAQGANQQASSLEEISSSLEEMASMIKQNAENASQAKNLANESDGNAKSGSEAMVRMSGAINRIKESSDQTAKIVNTIDEIAMQTNLLALNAAVEAARAGEAGRGFAVVAEEVRNLAQRSAQAAKNTADMISESVKNADDGVKIASEVAKSFEMIAESTKNVNGLVAEIATASNEQSQGIEQISTAVAQMDKVTQQNAANSEESASAAEELNSQSEELQSMIAQFNITSDKSRSYSMSKNSGNSRSAYQVQVNRKPAGTESSIVKNKKSSRIKDMPEMEDNIAMDNEILKEF